MTANAKTRSNPDPIDPPAVGLALVRLLACKRPPSGAQIQRDLAPLFQSAPSEAEIEAILERLRGEGALGEDGLLTEAGRGRALRWLGATPSDLPKRATWATVRDRLLPARALGLPLKEAKGRLASRTKLEVFLLERALGLRHGYPSVAAALEAHTCRELGHPEHETLSGLMAAICSRSIGADPPLGVKALLVQVPRVKNGGKTLVELRKRLLAGFVAPDLSDISAFARAVAEGASRCKEGRFGEDKIFLCALWESLQREPPFQEMGEGTFRERLLLANQRGLLSLARADLVQRMDRSLVARSETKTSAGTFHFLVAPESAR